MGVVNNLRVNWKWASEYLERLKKEFMLTAIRNGEYQSQDSCKHVKPGPAGIFPLVWANKSITYKVYSPSLLY